MLIKVGNEFLDMLPDTDVYIDRKVKLFEDISAADGDVSYTIELPPTTKNKRILGLEDINIKPKPIYNEVLCDILNDSGVNLYRGSLKVESSDKIIETTFYSGNAEWIRGVSGNMKDLDLSQYDIDFTLSNVQGTWDNSTGIVFPIFDKGKLSERLSGSLVFDEGIDEGDYLNNDFHPFLFIKDILPKVFASAGLKISGSLLKDYVYNNLITTNNASNQGELLSARSSYVGKTSTQSISSGVFTKITWIDNSDPYYDGDEDNFDNTNDRYVADVKMTVRISFNLDFDISSSTQQYDVEVRKNGTQVFDVISYWEGQTVSATLDLDASDYLEVFARPATSTAICQVGSFFKIDAIKLKKIFAKDVVPNLSKIDFIKNLIRIFNVVPTYNTNTKTVNLELFKNISKNEPQDLSNYLNPSTVRKKYFEFINEYGQKNILTYSEATVDEIEEYNETSETPYGAGSLDLDNSYLQDEQTIADLDFVAPYQYLNDVFGMSLLKLNYLGDSETEEDELTSVTDSSGNARFNFSGVPPFASDIGDIIRIKTTTTGVYIGTGVISDSGIGFFELAGVPFQGTCTGTFVKLNYTENSNTDPVLALHFTNTDVSVISSLITSVYINDTPWTNPVSYAYFFRHYQGGIGADDLHQGLSFGDITGNGFYQQNLKQTYYREFESVLNDPVKVYADFLLPESVFMGLDFTRPVRLKSIEANALFYLNKISGYKTSSIPCTLELIKL